MEKFFVIYLIGLVLISAPLIILLLRKGGFYDRFTAILALSPLVTIFLVTVGFVDGRRDMYVDIALSFAVLSFVSSVIVAKFMSGRGGKKTDD